MKVLRELNAALEVRDPYTRGHARRVERHAHRIALALRCSDDDIFDVRLAASLHDVGKIKVPDRILRKDGPLDDPEWTIMQQHSEVGAELVERLGNHNVVAAVRHHHERWDGRGYPDGVSGTQIPLGARIIAVADTFDAITSCRPYRDRSDRAHAISVLKSEAGKQFDPAVVSAFLSTTPHQAAAFAGLAALIAPLARRLTSQVGVLFNKAGAVGLAGTMTASAFTGAAVERPLAGQRADVEKPAVTSTVEDDAPDAEAAEGAVAPADPDRPGGRPTPRGKALGHAKKAHEGGNGKSHAGGNRKALGHSKKAHEGGNGKSHAGGNGKALGHSKKAHEGGNGKSNAGGQGKAPASAKEPQPGAGAAPPGKSKPDTADPTEAPPAAEAPAPAAPKPAKPKQDEADASDAADPVEAPAVPEPAADKAKGK